MNILKFYKKWKRRRYLRWCARIEKKCIAALAEENILRESHGDGGPAI